MSFVLDCSVTMAWLFENGGDDYTDAVLQSLESRSAFVPILWNYEVANVSVTALRTKTVMPAQVTQFLNKLRNLNIHIQMLHDLKQQDEQLVESSTTYGLTAYDSTYLKLAINRSLPLATRDQALKKACAKAGVSLYEP